MTASKPDSSDDNEAIDSHLSELIKESKKNKWDDDKVVRLLSLTYACRRRRMNTEAANTRIATSLSKYPCFKKPVYVCGLLFINKYYTVIMFLVSTGNVPLHGTEIFYFGQCQAEIDSARCSMERLSVSCYS